MITTSTLEALAKVAEENGVLRLGAVSLDHPGFAPAASALARHLDEGRHGEMQFMARTGAIRRDPTLMLEGARTLLVGVVPHAGTSSPIARYAQGPDYHTELHRRLEPVVEALTASLPGVRALACVDTKPIMERAAAALAGLGFLGKNGMLICPGLGSYVLLGSILCTAELAPPPVVTDLARVKWDACGDCRRCVDACPTGAFTAPGELDPRRCISYLTIEHRGPIEDALADQIGERAAGCDVCQEVCPYNAAPSREDRAPDHAWLSTDASPSVDLVELAQLRSGRYRAFVRNSALRRIPRRSLRRNALIALGNRSGDLSSDEREVATKASEDEDPQIRAAARRLLTRRRPVPH